MDTEDWTLQRVSSRPPHAQLTHHPPDRLFLCQCHPADTTMYASTVCRAAPAVTVNDGWTVDETLATKRVCSSWQGLSVRLSDAPRVACQGRSREARCQASCHATHDRGLSTAKDTVNHQPDMMQRVPGPPTPPGQGCQPACPVVNPASTPAGPWVST